MKCVLPCLFNEKEPLLLLGLSNGHFHPRGKYKINTDAAVFQDLGCCGVRVVIRNDKGQMMGAMCKRVGFLLGALEAEAKALEASLLLAWDLGLKDIVVWSDSQLVIQALNGSTPPLSLY